MILQKEQNRELAQSLRDLIPHSLRQHNVPGLNIALSIGGSMVLEDGFGYANLENQAPMSPRSVTKAGSMSKLYTATAVMQLIESGVMALYEPINRYLSGFRIDNPLGEREITLYDLLTHRSGINGGVDVQCDFQPARPISEALPARYRKSMLETYSGELLPLWSAKVGEKVQYSNLGSDTLGYLVEVTNPEKLDFSSYIRAHILEPLGMGSSLQPVSHDPAHVPYEIQERLSTGYAAFGEQLIPTPWLSIADYPAGSLLTTPGDHIRLLLAYLNGGEYQGSRILQPESVERMLTPQAKLPDGRSIGLIWWHMPLAGMDWIGHAGAYMFGWSSISLACPQYNAAFVACSNKWNMVPGGERYSAGLDIARYLAAWLQREAAGKRQNPHPRSWAWKVSYLQGMMMVDQLNGSLGISSPVTDGMLADMQPGKADAGDWDADGFAAGVRDLREVKMTPAAIRTFLESERCQVAFEEMVFLSRQIAPSGDKLLIPALLT